MRHPTAPSPPQSMLSGLASVSAAWGGINKRPFMFTTRWPPCVNIDCRGAGGTPYDHDSRDGRLFIPDRNQNKSGASVTVSAVHRQYAWYGAYISKIHPSVNFEYALTRRIRRPLHNHFAVASQSLHSHFTITSQSLHSHFMRKPAQEQETS